MLQNEGDDTESKFRINAEGLIETTAIPLDREARDLYRLVVAATDSGTPQRMVFPHAHLIKLHDDVYYFRTQPLSLSW